MARATVGRVALVVGSLPEIVPVNFTVAGETVVFGVQSQSVLASRSEGTVVAFQVDSFDPARESGWHVHAIGTLYEVLSAEELAVAGGTVPASWARGEEAERVVQIELAVVSGYVVEESPPTT